MMPCSSDCSHFNPVLDLTTPPTHCILPPHHTSFHWSKIMHGQVTGVPAGSSPNPLCLQDTEGLEM